MKELNINWFTLVLKLVAAYGIYLIVLGQTTSRLSAFCMALGVMILLLFAEYAVERFVARRQEAQQADRASSAAESDAAETE